jgi:hypothetical protein
MSMYGPPNGPPGGLQGARNAASSRLDSMGMGLAGAPAAGQGKQALGDVNYRAADFPGNACGACVHFQSPNACELVAGQIDEKATCDLFEPAGGGGGGGAAVGGSPAAAPPPPPAGPGGP